MYTATKSRSVVRDGDGAIIPDDPGNTDWQAYQAWLEAGNKPSPAPIILEPVATVPGDAVLGALSDAQVAASRLLDIARIAGNGAIPVTNPKLIRIAKANGMTPAALFSAAQSQ